MSTPENINYNAFRDPEDSELKLNENVKLSSSKSMFSQKQKSHIVSKEQFEKKVVEYQENEVELSNRISEAAKKYVFAIKNKTLSTNKSIIQKEDESFVIKELIDIGSLLNSDQTKPEGIGSIGLINLLLKINLEQRDIINDLSFKVAILEKKISS